MQPKTIPAGFSDFFLSLPPLEQAGFFLWPSVAADALTQEEQQRLESLKPSGCVLFKRNLKGIAQSRTLIKHVRALCEREGPWKKPLVVAIDEEGGRVSRLPPPFARGQPALRFAEQDDALGLKDQVLYQIFAAKGLGINCLLAPVADILTESANPAIGDRCFGDTAEKVSRYASLVHQTISAEGLFSCAKHFPGHGNTKTDSHKDISVSQVTVSELHSREWVPFKRLIDEGILFVMAAHVVVPALDPLFPATLSAKILTEQLKQSLHFQGLVLSDDLRMNAIALHYRAGNGLQSSITEENMTLLDKDDSFLDLAAIDALNAGCDILLSCQSVVQETRIAQAIASEMARNHAFFKNMLEKAWKIQQVIGS